MRAVITTSRTMEPQTRHEPVACCPESLACQRPCVVGLCQELRPAEPQEATIAEEVVPQPSDDELDAIERVVGYMFRNRDLLRRAFWCVAASGNRWVLSWWCRRHEVRNRVS